MPGNHDEHFLERLERLDQGHTEFALGLYHDREFITHLLQRCELPDAVERVALSLGRGERGPWIIVARDGHFVTCLAEGMSLQPDQHVVSRHRLDTIGESFSTLRELLGDAEAGGRRHTRRKLERLLRARENLSQEEFDELARWLPLLGATYMRTMMDAVDHGHLLFERLTRYKKLRSRHADLLQAYQESVWTVAHTSLLLGSDSGQTLRHTCETIDAILDEQIGLNFAWSLVRLGVSNLALRGAWCSSKMPSHVVGAAKRRYADPQATYNTTLCDGLSLMGAGLRHRRYRAEVAKVLGRFEGEDIDTEVALLHTYAHTYFGTYAEDEVREQFRAHTAKQARTLTRQLYEQLDSEFAEEVEKWPDEVVASYLMMVPIDLREELDSVETLFVHLPYVMGMEARDFYLPEPLNHSFGGGAFQLEEGLIYFNARLRGGVTRLQEPRRVGPKVGRNQPCPCGSGKKYKRCCWTE